MSLPSVNIVELDGSLGVLPNGSRAMAIVGVADAGPLNTPAAFARTKDVISNFTAGPLVEAACLAIQLTGKPVIVVRTGNTTVGTHTDLDSTGKTGTSVVTVTPGDTNGNDDYEPYFKTVAGGTIGVAGITYQWSLDGGRTLSPITALGTANTFVFPGSGGIGYSFAAGTLVAGDVIKSRAKAPQWTSGELTTALAALQVSGLAWEFAHIVGALDGTAFDAIELAFASMPERWWCGSFRLPTVAESDATYQAAFNTAFSAKATIKGAVAAGGTETTSAVTGRKYLRPVGFSAFSLQYAVSEEIDIAQVDLGGLPGVSLRDVNGNPKHHDESVNPGLDDMRAVSLRTIDGVPGIHVTNPRLLSTPGSDFEFTQHRRVMILARMALRIYFVRRLSKEILVSKDTGFILEEEALEIEEGARQAMAGLLMAKPKASDVDFTLSRTDNVLSTKTLTGQGFVTPLAYPKTINIELGFRNPALTVRAV